MPKLVLDPALLDDPLASDPRLDDPAIRAALACFPRVTKRTPIARAEPIIPLNWTPLPGPQTQGYDSPADILFFGGQAGGGKSDLLLGLAGTRHRKSIIFRREFPQQAELRERAHELYGSRGRFNSQAGVWHLDDGRLIEVRSEARRVGKGGR